jgi:hypothetical protein
MPWRRLGVALIVRAVNEQLRPDERMVGKKERAERQGASRDEMT